MVQIARLFKSVTRLNLQRRMASDTRDVLFKEEGGLGIITLNKPKALNSVNLCMVHLIAEKLKVWESQMQMILIEGVGRAFCAGGDVVAVTKDYPNKIDDGKKFFKVEYAMNNIIGNYKIPYIALLDGIVMGGGVGLSIHGKIRIATEKTMFAMPETAIGLFPDVGVCHFLSRLPGGIGLYLALTGSRLGGLECLNHGIATHYLDSKQVPKLKEAFYNCKIRADTLHEDLAKYTKDVKTCKNPIAEGPDLIDKIFVLPTIEEIFDALEKEGSGWSLETLKTLKKMSPISLKISIKHMQEAKTQTLQEVLQQDYRLVSHALCATVSRDFYEGVRAMLVDKDKNPKFKPETIKDISKKDVERCFEKVQDELELK